MSQGICVGRRIDVRALLQVFSPTSHEMTVMSRNDVYYVHEVLGVDTDSP
jgi:hypothetical protein